MDAIRGQAWKRPRDAYLGISELSGRVDRDILVDSKHRILLALTTPWPIFTRNKLE